jgi:phage terminase small subunit
MPVLKNPKHERFAQELAKGKTATESYTLAGYAPNQPNAARLISKDMVRARVAELQARSVIKTEITLASLMQEAGEIQAAAQADKQYSAATAALTAKAKLAGLWVDKAENTNRNVDPSRVSDAELAEVIQADSSTRITAPPIDPSQLN